MRAIYFDGKSAKAHDVNLEIRDGYIQISNLESGSDLIEKIDMKSLERESAVKDEIILFDKSGRKIRISGLNAENWLKTNCPPLTKKFSMYHWSPSKLTLLLVVFICTLTLVFLNIPALTGKLAFLVPYSIDVKLGKMTMKSVRGEYGGFCNDYAANRALKKLTTRLLNGRKGFEDVKTYIMNSSKINAFATPGNHFVILKGLIKEAQSPNELAGVVGHELGHLIGRHQIRQILGGLGVKTFALYMMKDANMAGDLSLDVASKLASLSFSRSQESDADLTAMELLNNAGIESRHFSDFFLRLSKKEDASFIKSLLSNHPELGERAEIAAKYGKPGNDAMTSEDWHAIKNACN